MRGVLMREEAEEEIQVLFKNLKSTSTYFSVGVDYSKPSLIGATYPTKFITDGKGTIGIGHRAHFLDLLSTIEPRYMSYMREAFAPIFLVTYTDKIIPKQWLLSVYIVGEIMRDNISRQYAIFEVLHLHRRKLTTGIGPDTIEKMFSRCNFVY